MAESLYSSIDVSGPDAFDFLQAQLTADLRNPGGDDVQLSAWCNPKGRVICLLRVQRTAEGFSLALPAELADTVVQRLTMFRFRAKVGFEIEPAAARRSGIGEPQDDWLLANLRAGIPEIWQAQSGAFTPHMLNLDLLGAVSLDKGCYPGQEIVARTHYRGASKRRMRLFESAAPVSAGDRVMHGERSVGDVVNAIGTELLAVVPTDAPETELTINGATLEPRPLPYA